MGGASSVAEVFAKEKADNTAGGAGHRRAERVAGEAVDCQVVCRVSYDATIDGIAVVMEEIAETDKAE